MKTKAAAAAAANKATGDEDEEDEPKKIRSSRSKKRRHARRSSTESESPPRKRSKKSGKRSADKKKSSKRGKVSSSRSRRRRSPSPCPSLSSSSPSSSSRSFSSSSERSVSPPPPPRSRSRDVKKRKGRGRDRDRERDPKRRKARRSTSSSGTSSSSGGSQARSKSSKRSTKDGTGRHKIEKDYDNRHASLYEKKIITDYSDRDEEALVVANKGRDSETERYEKDVSLETTDNPPYKDDEDILPAGDESPEAEDLELILRQKALENFRKFRAAASMSGKTDNGTTGKEMLADSPKNFSEARSAAAPFQRQASSLGVRHTTESPRSEGCRYDTSHDWKQESSAGMSRGAGSPRIFEDGSTQQEGRRPEATHSSPQPRSPQDGRNSRSVMHRLMGIPGSAASVNQRLGSSAGLSHVNGAPRIKSVVSIPNREGLDGCTTPQTPCETSAPVESSSEIRQTPIDTNKAEGTNGDGGKRSEPSASNGSILSSADGKGQVTETRSEDKDGSEFQKKTFSRMHDGETVEVSYKVYIPKQRPTLARRKLQR